jgi:hypothetical protein
MPLSPHLEPKVQVAAFRAHQALPVGRAQQHHYGRQPVNKYWFKDFKALTNTAGDRPAAGPVADRLEQLFLIRECLIKRCFDTRHSTLEIRDVKTAEAGRQEFMRDVERGHDRNAIQAADLALILDLLHFAIQIIDRFLQPFLLARLAGDAEFASHDGDLHA